MTSFPSPKVHVTIPSLCVLVGNSSVVAAIFCVVVVKLIFADDVKISSRTLIVLNGDSVIGLLLDAVGDDVVFVVTTAAAGLLTGRRVTDVDLTVEVFIIGFDVVVVDDDDDDGSSVLFSLTIEKDVVNAESSSALVMVVGSTLIIALVGRGFGRGALVVSTNETVENCSDDDVLVVDGLNVVGFLVVVEFLRDVDAVVVLRFTAIVDATGFLVPADDDDDVVVFITVKVAFLLGFGVTGLRDEWIVVVVVVLNGGVSVEATDVRLKTGFLLVASFVGFTFWMVVVIDGGAVVTFDEVPFLIEFWIDWNVVNLMLSVVLGGCSSLSLIVVDILRSIMLPSVVEKPPALTEYFSVVAVVRLVAGRFVANPPLTLVDDSDAAVVVISSKVLLL